MNKRIWQSAGKIFLSAVLIGNLSACVELAIGGAVASGIAASDRRTLGAQTEDKGIMLKAENRIGRLVGEAGHVNIASFNRWVLLTGEVKDEATKQMVEREARAIENVENVINELVISGISSLTSRSSDALITTKIKASFVNNRDLYTNSMKVVTERGAVYLMGRVTQNEGAIAAEVARTVSGVLKVVKIFEYISEEEKRKLTPESSQPQSAQ